MKLRGYQIRAIQDVFDFWKSRPDENCLLVAPTGAGKSILLAEICRLLTAKNEHRTILVLAHRKELIAQNADKFQKLVPEMACGVYSAGLGIRKIRRVTFAGIQSVYKRAADFGYISLVMIDECHLLSRNSTGMYQQLIAGLKKINPKLKIFGCSATPFRLDSGSLIGGDDAIFHDIAHEIDIRELIDDGYLSKLISKSSKININLDSVKVRGGDYVADELQMVMNEDELVKKSIRETIDRAGDRKSWLFFCSGVKHTEKVRDCLRAEGVHAEMVTGETFEMERDRILNDFKAGKLRALVNCDVLTTGFDAPNTDLVCLLRPTKSAGLYIQMVGRGMRISPETGKSDCLVLDFGHNIDRFGPIDTIKVRHNKKGGKSKIEKKMMKKCPECDEYTHISAKECLGCGYEFRSASINHSTIPTEANILSQIEEWDVETQEVKLHKKAGSPDMVRIVYYCGQGRRVNEFLCFDHLGFAGKRARVLWKEITGTEPPKSTEEALTRTFEIPLMSKIKIIPEGKFFKVLARTPRAASGHVIDDEPDELYEKYGVNI